MLRVQQPEAAKRRYVLVQRIGQGGMAEVFIGRQQAAGGFSRTVAIKRLHRNLTDDESFVNMLLDEARLASRVQHPNVVSATDVLEQDGEVLLVMDYVVGETLGKILRRVGADGGELPIPVVAAIVGDVLAGLHAAHVAIDETGTPLGIVHRDVSPQNILIGSDGTARVLDFGIAKAESRISTTREGQLKGKLGYMAPEQLRQHAVDARTDVFAAGVVLWECLTGRRLFAATDPAAVVTAILMGELDAPSVHRRGVPEALDAVVLRALERDPDDRYSSAWEMAAALETAVSPVSSRAVAEWLAGVAGDLLTERRRLVVASETPSSGIVRPAAAPGAPVTEVEFSDVSSKPRRRAGWATAAGGALLAMAVTVTAARFLGSDDAPAESEVGATAESPAKAQSGAPPVVPGAPLASSSTLVPSSSTPVQSSSMPAASSSTPAPAPRAPSVAMGGSRWRPQPRKPDCKVERYLDQDGTPRFKKVCK